MLRLSKIVSGDSVKQSPIRKIMEMADPKNIARMGLNPKDIISFAGGWVNHDAPEGLRREYQKIANDKDLFHKNGGYTATEGDFEFRTMIAEMEKKIYGIRDLTPDNIIVGQSSTQVLFSLFIALLDADDKIVIFDPTYANYIEQLHAFRKNIKVISLNVFNKGSWTYMQDEDEILKSLKKVILKDKPKAILVCSPDNPTGQMLSDRFVEKMLNVCLKYGVFVLIDNAYKAQYYTIKRPKQFSLSPNDHENLIMINSNSKWCRGLGRRLGWVEANKKIISALKTVQQTVVLCPDTMHQTAMTNYLKYNLKNGSLKAYLEDNRNKYKLASEFTSKCIEKYLQMRYLKPQGGLYTVVDVKMDGDKFVQNVLKNVGVIFVPGSGFGKSLTNGIRISFGPLVNNLGKIEEGFLRVKKFLEK